MPPAALVGMIGESTDASALGAGNAGADMDQADSDAALIELEVDGLDLPGLINAQQPGVMRVVHARTLRNASNRP